MLMQEFVTRFAAQEEGSVLFEILRRISRVDPQAVVADPTPGWIEWPPVDGSSTAGIGIARA